MALQRINQGVLTALAATTLFTVIAHQSGLKLPYPWIWAASAVGAGISSVAANKDGLLRKGQPAEGAIAVAATLQGQVQAMLPEDGASTYERAATAIGEQISATPIGPDRAEVLRQGNQYLAHARSAASLPELPGWATESYTQSSSETPSEEESALDQLFKDFSPNEPKPTSSPPPQPQIEAGGGSSTAPSPPSQAAAYHSSPPATDEFSLDAWGGDEDGEYSVLGRTRSDRSSHATSGGNGYSQQW